MIYKLQKFLLKLKEVRSADQRALGKNGETKNFFYSLRFFALIFRHRRPYFLIEK